MTEILFDEELEKAVLAELAKRTPWDKIAKKFKVSSKTINRIKAKHTGASRTEGEVAAKAFDMFQSGRKPVRVVIELQQPPGVIWSLYEEWAKMRDAWLISGSTRDELSDQIWSSADYDASSQSNFVDAVKALVNDHRELMGFSYPCKVCNLAVQASSGAEWKWILSKGYLAIWGHHGCLNRAK